MEFVRTPDERFAALLDWPYVPRYIEGLPGYGEMRMHYVDEGPRDGEVLLCLHGEPTWSYLYRKMIPVFTAAGFRVVAPDWFGFGRSDKPTDDAVYTWDFFRSSLFAFLDALGLERFGLVCQDWGGLLGLTIPVDRPGAIGRLLIMNTALATGQAPSAGFVAWRSFVASQPDIDVGRLMQRSAGLDEATAAAYSAPFVDRSYKAGVRRFPALVATDPAMDGAQTARAAAQWWSRSWFGPTFMAIGVEDPVLGPDVMESMRRIINGCPEPMQVQAGHFVQEAGEAVAKAALDAWDAA